MIGRRLMTLVRGPTQFIRISCPASSTRSAFSRLIAVSARRGYATPGRPRSTVGEPSKPVKRAAKRTTTGTTTGTTKTKVKAAAKKPKKKAAKKPVKKAKKPLTEAQLAKKKVNEERALVKELKVQALVPPPRPRRIGPHEVYQKEWHSKHTFDKGDKTAQAALVESTAARIRDWKALSPAELEHYNHLANTQTQEMAATYDAWVRQHTPEQITAANSARSKLRRREKKSKGHHSSWPDIADDRTVAVVTPFAQFVRQRHASGDLKRIAFADATKLISQEWKELPESEKQKYKNLYKQSHSQVADQHKAEYGNDVGYMNTSTQGQAASAAA